MATPITDDPHEQIEMRRRVRVVSAAIGYPAVERHRAAAPSRAGVETGQETADRAR